MNQYKRLRGFTLIEMILSMALMGSVILIGGQIYQIFYAYLAKYQKSVYQTYESASLQNIIQHDVWEASSLNIEEDSVKLMDRNQALVSTYFQGDSMLFRFKHAQIDSFSFQGIWRFSKSLRGFQLVDTVHRFTYTFPFLPMSESRIPSSFSPIIRSNHDES